MNLKKSFDLKFSVRSTINIYCFVLSDSFFMPFILIPKIILQNRHLRIGITKAGISQQIETIWNITITKARHCQLTFQLVLIFLPAQVCSYFFASIIYCWPCCNNNPLFQNFAILAYLFYFWNFGQNILARTRVTLTATQVLIFIRIWAEGISVRAKAANMTK